MLRKQRTNTGRIVLYSLPLLVSVAVLSYGIASIGVKRISDAGMPRSALPATTQHSATMAAADVWAALRSLHAEAARPSDGDRTIHAGDSPSAQLNAEQLARIQPQLAALERIQSAAIESGDEGLLDATAHERQKLFDAVLGLERYTTHTGQ